MARNLGLALLAIGLLTAACGADADVAETVIRDTTPTPAADTTLPTSAPTSAGSEMAGELSQLPNVDPGVAESVEFFSASQFRTFAADLVPSQRESGARLIELSGCHLRAPGEWVISGSVELPDGSDVVSIGFHLEQLSTDMVDTVAVGRFTAAESGEFALLFDVFALEPDGHPRQWSGPVIRPLWHSDCILRITHASVASEEVDLTVPLSYRALPLEWSAQPDTIELLGSGVVLADPEDPRLGWAYLSWTRQVLGLPEVWVPDLPRSALLEASAGGDSPCVRVSVISDFAQRYQDDAVRVVHRRDCQLDSMFQRGSEEPSTVDGFVLMLTEVGEPVLMADLNGTIVTVESVSAPVGALEEVARSLRPFENLLFEPVSVSGTNDELDVAIADVLEPLGATERGRLALDGDYVIIATWVEKTSLEVAGGARLEHFDDMVGSFTARETNGRWVVNAVGGGGGGDLCLWVDSGGAYTEDGRLVDWASWTAIVGAGRDWTIQHMAADGWQSLETIDGVHFSGSTESLVVGYDQVRAIDAEGRVIRCSTTSKGADEVWSPWQPATARTDLPVAVDSVEGQTVVVEGSGLYPDTFVTLHICRYETINWVDFLDCDHYSKDDQSEETILSRHIAVAVDGSFSASVALPVAFETYLGDQVDCRTERCVIRVDGDRGYHQAGWVEVSFNG